MSERGFAHNLYNFMFVQAVICASTQRSAFRTGVVGLTPIGMQVQLLLLF